jgi:phosphoribosyl 1,2-cyclic phosphodiesterase
VPSLTFLGTGAGGGTPGEGRSRRRESSLLAVHDDTALVVDVTRDFGGQARRVDQIAAVLLTHAHRDAAGGIAHLRSWCAARAAAPVPMYASPQTLEVVRRRFARLEHVRAVPVREGATHRQGPWRVEALEVPHARDPATPTYAWRLTAAGTVIVYASDVARLTDALERFAERAALLVVDGSMWKRRIFSHLTIDAALEPLCRWSVDRIALTHIGRSAPPHEHLEREARDRCARAFPAYDGLRLSL